MLNILLIDTNKERRRRVLSALEGCGRGYVVVTTHKLEHGLSFMKRWNAEVILLNMTLEQVNELFFKGEPKGKS